MERRWAGEVADQVGKVEEAVSAARMAAEVSADDARCRALPEEAETMGKVVEMVWAEPLIQRGIVGRESVVVEDMLNVMFYGVQ